MRYALSGLILLAAAIAPQANSQAVTVIGGGLARECYESVESGRVANGEAMRTCDLALAQEQLSPRNRAATYTNRGILHMRSNRFERAMEDFERGLASKPNLLEAKVNYGAALYNLKRYPDALSALNEGVQSEDVRAKSVGYYNRGLTNEKLGDITQAYKDFRTALELQPEFKLAADQLTRFTVVTQPE